MADLAPVASSAPAVVAAPIFKIDPDTAYALAVGTIALIGSSFVPSPAVAHALQFVGGELTLMGAVFHLDGK